MDKNEGCSCSGDWKKGSQFTSYVWTRLQRSSQSQWGQIFCPSLLWISHQTSEHKNAWKFAFTIVGAGPLSRGLPEKPWKFAPSIPSRHKPPLSIPSQSQSYTVDPIHPTQSHSYTVNPMWKITSSQSTHPTPPRHSPCPNPIPISSTQSQSPPHPGIPLSPGSSLTESLNRLALGEFLLLPTIPSFIFKRLALCRIQLLPTLKSLISLTGSLNSSSADLSENAIRSGHKVNLISFIQDMGEKLLVLWRFF